MKMISTLIIDDDPVARKLLNAILQQNFANLQIVGNAVNVQSGLEMIETHNPELVFLDVEMPDGTAFELLDQLPERRFDLAVVSSCDEYNAQAYEYAAQKFLQKPLCIEELKCFVREMIFGCKERLELQTVSG